MKKTSFDASIEQWWNEHATDAEGVFARLAPALALAQTNEHLASLALLIQHVAGEHLGRWPDGLALLEGATRLSFFVPDSPGGKGVFRALAVLATCAGDGPAAASWSEKARLDVDPLTAASDRIRILAPVATILTARGRGEEGERHLEEALTLAAYGPGRSDPACRALAMAGNNIALELEERASLSPLERRLMIRAAATARRYWETAGTWLQVERAEYRLARTMLAAGEPGPALRHATQCLEICEDNQAVPYERFFAHEALALAHKALGQVVPARIHRDQAAALIAEMKADFQAEAAAALASLDRTFAAPQNRTQSQVSPIFGSDVPFPANQP